MKELDTSEEKYENPDIAVIGMSCRFPGAKNVSEFWDNLAKGKESIRRLTDQEILDSGVESSYLHNSSYVKASPVLDDPGLFDASFFGFSSGEALKLDPQHRILLTCAYEALENAGYDPGKFNGRIGVYTGSAMNTYLLNTRLYESFHDEYIPTLIGNDKDFLSTRISYKLNLKGPSLNVQTACSTSLVAVHLACQSLLIEESDMAIAGAVSVRVPHYAGYVYDGGGIVSPDGHVRAFDAKANGTVFGSGAGIIVLKRLYDALKDHDNILAVIKGSAINNDGFEKAAYTAPGIKSQEDVVVDAISNSGITAEDISYIEAHGSGTPVGDPIEITALSKAFRKYTNKKNFCAIGSVKTNIGHLDAAAGIAGIIKTVLALQERKIPASINFEEANREINFSDTPFYVNSFLREWKSNDKRIAGVMSTGMGGTNAHIIIEEAPEIRKKFQPESPALLLLSAKDDSVLENQTGRFLNYLMDNSNLNLRDAAYTLQCGRKEFEHRKFLIAEDRLRAIEILKQNNSKNVFMGKILSSSRRPVIFLFPGLGDHYVGMGYNLYREVKVFKDEVDKCAEILHKYLDCDIRDILYPMNFGKKSPDGGIDLKKMLAGRNTNAEDPNSIKLNLTLFAQPALFTIEYALAKLWIHLGIVPEAIAGHSMGEYVAACLSGVLSLEDALKLIAKRAKLVNDLPPGGMLAVILPEKEILPLLDEKLSISLINSPELCVVAGAEESINKFEKVLSRRDILYRRVQNAHAFHSKMMDPIFDKLVDEIKQVKLNYPQIPFISNVTGDWITDSDAINPHYWAKHTTSTSRFSDALEKVWQVENCILIEAGPGNTLSVLAQQHPGKSRSNTSAVFPSLRPEYQNQSDQNYLLKCIGKLWLNGVSIKWEGLYEEDNLPGRIPLPTYPFQEKNYWLKSKLPNRDIQKKSKLKEFDSWFYVPGWERSDFRFDYQNTIETNEKKLWLIFLDINGLGLRLQELLKNNNQEVITVDLNDSFRKDNAGNYSLDYRIQEHYESMFSEIKSINPDSLNIIHLGSFSDQDNSWFDYEEETLQFLGFYSLVYISKALGKLNYSIPVNIEVISSHIHQVIGTEELTPAKALILGPCGVIPKEFSNIKCFNIDLLFKESIPLNKELQVKLLSEFDKKNTSSLIAYRGKFRWIKKYDNISLANRNTRSAGGDRIKKHGVYLITGGTGGIGLTLAKYLAEEYQAKLVLTQKSEIPDKAKWQQVIEGDPKNEALSQKLRKLRELENLGAEVIVLQAQMSDVESMKKAIFETENLFGRINGIIHCAGIVRAGMIQAKQINDIKNVLAPKVKGTLVLYELIKNKNPDFFILCSSITAVTTPFAEIDYSAANSFLDVFSHYLNKKNKFFTLSINWPGWKETGQLVNLKTQKGTYFWKQEALRNAISSHDGLEAFKLGIGSDYSQLIISPRPLKSYRNYPAQFNGSQSKNQEESVTPDPDIDSESEKLSIIWKDILGVKEIKKDDNFFELGGHSLLAIQLISAVRKTFKVDLTLEDVFNAVTFTNLERKVYDSVSAVQKTN